MAETYRATCFCGAVEIEVTGKPASAGYCHCKDCQGWSGAPINAYTIWPAGAVRVVKGEADIGTFSRTGQTFRKYCKLCGGHIMADLPGPGLVDVFANRLDGFTFQPSVHINYGSRLMAVKDGLPKFKDFPSQIGGSGEMLPE